MSVEEEFRPPVANAFRDAKDFHEANIPISMTLIKKGHPYEIMQSAIRNEKGVLQFYDGSKWEGLDFEPFLSQTTSLYRAATKQGYNVNQSLPSFYENSFRLGTQESMSPDEHWLGAMVFSRAEITQRLVMFMVMDRKERKSILTTDGIREPKTKSTRFWAFYPSPKPANLHNFLKVLSNGIQDDEKGYFLNPERTGLCEGFYRMTITRREPDADSVSIIYDDGSSRESDAYFESGSVSVNPLEARFRPRNVDLGALRIWAPLAFRTKNDVNGDWGFTGPNQSSKLFILQGLKPSGWCSPIKSEADTKQWNDTLKEFYKELKGEKGDIIKNAIKEAGCFLRKDAFRNRLVCMEVFSKINMKSRALHTVVRDLKIAGNRLVVSSIIDDVLKSIGNSKKRVRSIIDDVGVSATSKRKLK